MGVGGTFKHPFVSYLYFSVFFPPRPPCHLLLYGLRSCVSNNADSLQLRNYFKLLDEIPTLLKHNCLDICKTALFTNRLFEGPLNILFDVSISVKFVCIKALKVSVDFVLRFLLSIILSHFNSPYDQAGTCRHKQRRIEVDTTFLRLCACWGSLVLVWYPASPTLSILSTHRDAGYQTTIGVSS